MKDKRKPAVSLQEIQENRCIICGKASINGKYMYRQCSEEIRVDQEKAQAI